MKKLNTTGVSHIILPILVVLSVAIVGTYLLVSSHADSLNKAEAPEQTVEADIADPADYPDQSASDDAIEAEAITASTATRTTTRSASKSPTASTSGYRGNPFTYKCPGNTPKYGVPHGKTATVSARQKVFGSPGSHLVRTSFMGKAVVVNSKIAPCLRAVQYDLKVKYATKYKVNYIWGYANNSNGHNPPNYFHVYGGAVDINPPTNPFYTNCRKSCPHNMPSDWVAVFRAHGFYWGGNFVNSKDYMHFEWHGQL